MVEAGGAPKLSEEEMQMIYNWVDEIPLSRPKRNIARDFSDGGKYPHSSILSQSFYSSLGGWDREAFRATYSGAT